MLVHLVVGFALLLLARRLLLTGKGPSSLLSAAGLGLGGLIVLAAGLASSS